MIVVNSELDGVRVIEPPTNFEDFRGSYVEIYNQRLYQDEGIDDIFVQDDISVSRKGVLRVSMETVTRQNWLHVFTEPSTWWS